MINYRYDEFLDLLKPVLCSETIKVPATAPYYVSLQEIPFEMTPSTVLVRDAASTGTANPDQDCSVLQSTGGNSDITSLYCGREVAGVGGGIRRCFMRFNIASLPSSPSKVVLRVFLNKFWGDAPLYNAGSQTVGIYRLTSSWTETGPTWASQPTYDTTPVGAIAFAPPVDGKVGAADGYGGWFECDVTALYNAWKSGTNNGLMLKADESLYGFSDIDSSEGSNPPQLVVISAGALYTQVGQTVAPTNSKEYACAYSTGRLRFHSGAAGLTLNVDYQGIGSPVDAQDVGLRATTTGGTSTAYTISTASGRAALVPLLMVIFRVHTGCGNNATLNVDSTGGKNLQIKGVNVTAGQLATTGTYIAIYDGTAYQVIGA